MLRTTEHVYHCESQAYMRRNPVIQITRYNIAVIFGTAFNKGVSPDNLVGAFKKTGVFPMDKMANEDVKTAPSAIYIYETGDHMPDHDIETAKSLDSNKIVKVSAAPRKRKTVTIMGDLSCSSKKKTSDTRSYQLSKTHDSVLNITSPWAIWDYNCTAISTAIP